MAMEIHGNHEQRMNLRGREVLKLSLFRQCGSGMQLPRERVVREARFSNVFNPIKEYLLGR